MTVWFAFSAFCCSALLFWLEPLVGKQLLPLLGGAPTVWGVCLLFFQCALLVGYGLAHAIARVRSRTLQIALFGGLVLAACLTLPVTFAQAPLESAGPVPWLFGQLALQVALPFVALAAAAPLLQHWATGLPNPYLLYAASNAGSLLALLAFPLLLEPAWSLAAQQRGWAIASSGALALAVSAAFLRPGASTAQLDISATTAAPTLRAQLHWLMLSAAPSSLLLGVTAYLTTDLAPVPLLWILPLALYLLTFIAAFAGLPARALSLVKPLTVMLAVIWVGTYRLRLVEPLALLLPLHLITFLCVVFLCHSRLATLRPPRERLTHYYLVIALGGVLGGAFNTLAAPLLFDAYIEYPLFLVAALILGLHDAQPSRPARMDLLFAAGLLLAMLGMLSIDRLGVQRWLSGTLTVGLPVLIAFVMRAKSWRLVLCLSAILVSAWADRSVSPRHVFAERNFFGVLRVTTDARGRFRELRHGNTLHGAVDLAQPGGSRPLSYYSYRSPGTDIVRSLQERRTALNVGVVGLGVGSMAWYARPLESWTFFEINPAVVSLASSSNLFPFLQHSRAQRLQVRQGDARLSLANDADGAFDLLVLDAFTSDAIPMHLLTREALQLFMDTIGCGWCAGLPHLQSLPRFGARAGGSRARAGSAHPCARGPESQRRGTGSSHSKRANGLHWRDRTNTSVRFCFPGRGTCRKGAGCACGRTITQTSGVHWYGEALRALLALWH